MSVNAEPFLDAYANLLQNTDKYIISSHCPIVVNLIEQKFPKLLEHLAPIKNEAVIHAQLLKQNTVTMPKWCIFLLVSVWSAKTMTLT